MGFVFIYLKMGLATYLSFFPFFMLTFILIAGAVIPAGLLCGFVYSLYVKR